MGDIKIFDDFLSLEQQDNIEREVLRNVHFRWRSSYSRLFPPPNLEEATDSRPLAMDAPKDGKIKIKDNKFWNQSRPGLMVGECFEYHHGWTWWSKRPEFQRIITEPLEHTLGFPYTIQRIKINFNAQEIIENDGSCYVPHVDIEDGGGLTGIYYINDSDGDTVIFNEKDNTPIRNNEEISVRKVIKNKRGRLVLFDQSLLHAGCPPIKSNQRLVINFNIKKL
jgi:hypothetical protein|tara:strand:- start:15 stop:683 length:669 start_codon:yes stop_codon:yes gene_type:complete